MHWQKTTSAMATQEGSEAGSAAKGCTLVSITGQGLACIQLMD